MKKFGKGFYLFVVVIFAFFFVSTKSPFFAVSFGEEGSKTCPYNNILNECTTLGCGGCTSPPVGSYTYCYANTEREACLCMDPRWLDPPECSECSIEGRCGVECKPDERCVAAENGVLVCRHDDECSEEPPSPPCKHIGACGAKAEACPVNHVCKDTDGDSVADTCQLDTTGYYCVLEGACQQVGKCGSAVDGQEGKYCKVDTFPPYRTLWEDAPCLYGADSDWKTKDDCLAHCKSEPKICCSVLGTGECIPDECGIEAGCEPGELCMFFHGSNHWGCSLGPHDKCSGDAPYEGPVYNGPIIESLEEILNPVVRILYYGGLFVGIFFIILSGYKLMTSEGDPQRTKEAQEQLTSAIIGIIFILLSTTIIRIIISEIIGI